MAALLTQETTRDRSTRSSGASSFAARSPTGQAKRARSSASARCSSRSETSSGRSRSHATSSRWPTVTRAPSTSPSTSSPTARSSEATRRKPGGATARACRRRCRSETHRDELRDPGRRDGRSRDRGPHARARLAGAVPMRSGRLGVSISVASGTPFSSVISAGRARARCGGRSRLGRGPRADVRRCGRTRHEARVADAYWRAEAVARGRHRPRGSPDELVGLLGVPAADLAAGRLGHGGRSSIAAKGSDPLADGGFMSFARQRRPRSPSSCQPRRCTPRGSRGAAPRSPASLLVLFAGGRPTREKFKVLFSPVPRRCQRDAGAARGGRMYVALGRVHDRRLTYHGRGSRLRGVTTGRIRRRVVVGAVLAVCSAPASLLPGRCLKAGRSPQLLRRRLPPARSPARGRRRPIQARPIQAQPIRAPPVHPRRAARAAGGRSRSCCSDLRG